MQFVITKTEEKKVNILIALADKIIKEKGDRLDEIENHRKVALHNLNTAISILDERIIPFGNHPYDDLDTWFKLQDDLESLQDSLNSWFLFPKKRKAITSQIAYIREELEKYKARREERHIRRLEHSRLSDEYHGICAPLIEESEHIAKEINFFNNLRDGLEDKDISQIILDSDDFQLLTSYTP